MLYESSMSQDYTMSQDLLRVKIYYEMSDDFALIWDWFENDLGMIGDCNEGQSQNKYKFWPLPPATEFQNKYNFFNGLRGSELWPLRLKTWKFFFFFFP